jgi:hypothetical protein
LSFSSEGEHNVKVDADIDVFTEVLFHVFGEVFWHSLTGLSTSPFQVFGVLLKDQIQPEYRLVPRAK